MAISLCGHANPLKAISISFIAGGLVFKGLREALPGITGHSAIGLKGVNP